MPTNGYDPSSQTVFSPRQSVLPSGYSPAKIGVVSSRTPALRAASAGPSAVRPAGLGDRRESFSETTVVRPAVPVDGERPALRGWQDKGALGERLKARPSLRRVQKVSGALCRTPEVPVHKTAPIG